MPKVVTLSEEKDETFHLCLSSPYHIILLGTFAYFIRTRDSQICYSILCIYRILMMTIQQVMEAQMLHNVLASLRARVK
jgi:hypothetical protein